ncbi:MULTISPECIES: TIGR03617 family F420-dependent LLM class oxidoreductase [Nocardia]|uniref:TIGR03617 family F420-dependent LLM class oxidoreductase n=1 Tax=Nocardia TaxID=1817 RepID=UPI001E5E8F51|nr:MULTISPECIES: TIGR03617 family F420-dependent LLM class oxidoreductase [Nocardia]
MDAAFLLDFAQWRSAARQAEDVGFDGVVSPELAHDPFLPLATAAGATSRVDLITGIAVAFARSPMTVAVTASDLHRGSDGRMILGLGTQVKAHISRRYSMTWSHPAARMREYVLALRAIWSSWNEREPLRFEGEFYRHTLMTPVFDPGPSPVGDPRIFLAAVGPAMTEVAGEVADGLMLHGFTTPAFVREVTMPRLKSALTTAGRRRSDIEVTLPVMALIAATERERTEKVEAARAQLAFYGSTPAYRPVLEHHGWGALGDELHRLSRDGAWTTMAALIDDQVVETFNVIAESPTAAAAEILRRYGTTIDRLQIGFDPTAPSEGAALLAAIRTATATPDAVPATDLGIA